MTQSTTVPRHPDSAVTLTSDEWIVDGNALWPDWVSLGGPIEAWELDPANRAKDAIIPELEYCPDAQAERFLLRGSIDELRAALDELEARLS